MDENFEELIVKIQERVAVKDENSDLIQVVAKQSPFLSSLEFNFGKPITAEMGATFAQSFLQLKYLTSLTITEMTDHSYCIPFLENLGTNCPKLEQLCIKSEFIFEARHILALLIGEQLKLFPKLTALMEISELSTQMIMQRTRIYPKHLTPICNSLKSLLLQCVQCQDYGNQLEGYPHFYRPDDEEDSDDGEDNRMGRFYCACASHHLPRHLLTFLLRHIPNLEKMAEPCCANYEPSRAVGMIHTIPSRLEKASAADEEESFIDEEDDAFEAVVNNQLFFGKQHKVYNSLNLLNLIIVNCNILGSLSLVDLGSVNITSHSVMTFIASLCSRPKVVSFSDPSASEEHPNRLRQPRRRQCGCGGYHSNSDGDSDVSSDDDDARHVVQGDSVISKDKLRKILKTDWPKVITMLQFYYSKLSSIKLCNI